MSLFQNFPSFLVKPFIFAVNIVLIAKNGDKVDPLEMFTSETVTFYGSTLFAFFTLKMRGFLIQKKGEMRAPIGRKEVLHQLSKLSESERLETILHMI